MSTDQPVRMLEDEPTFDFDENDEEFLGRYLQIGDVAKSIGVNPSVLRFWEQEFPQLRPTKRGNRRYYSSDDVELIRTIQHLLYEEHYTIIGARNKIHELVCRDKVDNFMDQNVPSMPLTQELKASQAQAELLKETLQALDLSDMLAKLKAIRAILTGQDAMKEVAAQAQPEAPLEPIQEKKSEPEAFSFDLDWGSVPAEPAVQTPAQPARFDTPQRTPITPAAPTAVLPTMATPAQSVSAAPTSPIQSTQSSVPSATDASLGQVQPSAMTAQTEQSSQTVKPLEKAEQQHEEKKASRLPIPPLPSQQRAFTIGMTVSPQMKKNLFWKR